MEEEFISALSSTLHWDSGRRLNHKHMQCPNMGLRRILSVVIVQVTSAAHLALTKVIGHACFARHSAVN